MFDTEDYWLTMILSCAISLFLAWFILNEQKREHERQNSVAKWQLFDAVIDIMESDERDFEKELAVAQAIGVINGQ